jgi:pyruvate dehydrogenase E1 component alpha subunit
MGTALARAQAETDLSLRAASYGMPAWPVDAMDVFAVQNAARRAVEGIRGGAGPCFLELRTYRFRAHSMFDPDRYRDKAEIERWRERDPVERLTAQLRADGDLTADDLAALEQEVGDELAHAIEAAEAAPLEPVEELTRFVYSASASPR